MVKPNVAKLLVDALLTSNMLKQNILQQVQEICYKLQWNDAQSTEKGVKKIMGLLEQGAGKR